MTPFLSHQVPFISRNLCGEEYQESLFPTMMGYVYLSSRGQADRDMALVWRI